MSRDKFEEWFRKDYMSGLDDAGKFDEQRNCYVELSVHMAWKGWLAGRESMRDEAANHFCKKGHGCEMFSGQIEEEIRNIEP